MLELFLTAFVRDGPDFERASAVLHGLTNMSGWETKHRVLFFCGPLPPKPFSVVRSIPRSPYNNFWGELSQATAKISYILQARYEVFPDKDFGGGGGGSGGEGEQPQDGAGNVEPVDFNKLSGTLRFTDFPKPTDKSDKTITQRKKIEIPEQKNMIAVLKDNNHRFKSEAIEESVSFFSDNIEYTLVRHYMLPAVSDNRGPQPLPALPAWDALERIDPAGTWTLLVKTTVQEDNSPEKAREAVKELLIAQAQLAGVLDFKIVDRRVHDTRMLQPINNMPAPLPQTQRIRT